MSKEPPKTSRNSPRGHHFTPKVCQQKRPKPLNKNFQKQKTSFYTPPSFEEERLRQQAEPGDAGELLLGPLLGFGLHSATATLE